MRVQYTEKKLNSMIQLCVNFVLLLDTVVRQNCRLCKSKCNIMRCVGVSYCNTTAPYCTIIIYMGSKCTVCDNEQFTTLLNSNFPLTERNLLSEDYHGKDQHVPSTAL